MTLNHILYCNIKICILEDQGFFLKLSEDSTELTTEYDIDSVMHVHETARIVNRKTSMVINSRSEDIGLSGRDIMKINQAYKCDLVKNHSGSRGTLLTSYLIFNHFTIYCTSG